MGDGAGGDEPDFGDALREFAVAALVGGQAGRGA
jgi:hypothetical protein